MSRASAQTCSPAATMANRLGVEAAGRYSAVSTARDYETTPNARASCRSSSRARRHAPDSWRTVCCRRRSRPARRHSANSIPTGSVPGASCRLRPFRRTATARRGRPFAERRGPGPPRTARTLRWPASAAHFSSLMRRSKQLARQGRLPPSVTFSSLYRSASSERICSNSARRPARKRARAALTDSKPGERSVSGCPRNTASQQSAARSKRPIS